MPLVSFVCVLLCVGVCKGPSVLHMWKTEDNPGFHSADAIFFFFSSRFSHWLGIHQDHETGQQALGICLSRPPQYWDRECASHAYFF